MGSRKATSTRRRGRPSSKRSARAGVPEGFCAQGAALLSVPLLPMRKYIYISAAAAAAAACCCCCCCCCFCCCGDGIYCRIVFFRCIGVERNKLGKYPVGG